MTNHEQIRYLNATVKCKIGSSKVHGVGIIAIKDIKKGEKLYCFPDFYKNGLTWFTLKYANFNKLWPEIKELILERWPSVINGSHFLSPNEMAWLITYMNHGESENENYDVATDTAIKDIPKGSEVLENYKRMDNWEKIYPWIKND